MLRALAQRRLVPAAIVFALALTATATAAIVGLPPDASQVNNDPASSIDPNQDAGVSDVAGGALTAGAPGVPWATFEQKLGSSQQIFVRAFRNGAWSTQGHSLNIDPAQVAEGPSIDFAGASRTVPWDAWYEPNSHLGTGTQTNVFASRFDAGGNAWVPEGQDRAPANRVPSLNINVDRTAENPSVAGGATVAGNAPVPWVAWQEHDGALTDAAAKPQIFVSRGIKQTDCSANQPGGGTSVSQFCWQQVGIKRLARTAVTSTAATDPTLSVDPSRDAVEPDIAFTGPSDTVPWVIWYEETPSGIGLNDNQEVFAAKGVADATADGGFHWVAVGRGTAGQTNVLDTSGATHHFGPCTESTSQEQACSLNAVPGHDAQNARVAAGSLTAGGVTVPWVVWDEDNGAGIHQVFVARLVGGDHFELFNNGQPLSNPANDSIRADITFSGHTPYITWQESASHKAFAGHFEGGAFQVDAPGGIAGVVDDLREPISSSCIATPFNADGDSCQGAAAGTPFFLHLDQAGGAGVKRLQSGTYAPSDVTTGDASSVTQTAATISGSLNPGGTVARVHAEFGTTTAYGSRTDDQRVGPAIAPVAVSAAVSGLPPGTTIHYRFVATSDFGTFAGADRTFATPAVVIKDTTPPHVSVVSRRLTISRRGIVRVVLKCPATETAGCKGTLTLRTVRKVAITKTRRRLLVLGHKAFTIRAGRQAIVNVRVSLRGRRLVRRAHQVRVSVIARAVDPAGNVGTTTKRLTLRPRRR